MKDSQGVEILPSDDVIVIAYGYGARLVDTQTRSRVVRFGSKRIVIIDVDRYERAVHPRNLSVVNRATGKGFEHNRQKLEQSPLNL